MRARVKMGKEQYSETERRRIGSERSARRCKFKYLHIYISILITIKKPLGANRS
jgi:hypothetical protein